MAITRTAKGTAQSKAANTTLTISSVSLTAGDLLVVGIGYETDFALNTVEWGARDLKLTADSAATQGDTRVRIYRVRVKNTDTRDLTATWAGNMSARCMFATAVTETSKKDVGSTATFAAGTTAPNTGTAVTSTVADTISIAAFVSGGPSGDTAGTAGDGHTLGQRVGTTGGGAASNVTIQETFEILSATGNVRASLTGATGRIWACSIAAFRAVDTYKIIGSYHRPEKVYPARDIVVLQVEDGATARVYDIQIPTQIFEIMTDQEVTDYAFTTAAWHADLVESENDLELPDSTIETRLTGFENDTFTV